MSKRRAKSATRPTRGETAHQRPFPDWTVLALIAVVTIVAYGPALGGQMLWDDQVHVPKPAMQSLDGLRRMWTEVGATQQYYPMLFSSFWMQHQLWGDQMLGYHLVTLLEHLAAAYLLYAVLRKLEIPGALLATAVFALHPVHVESVAWVTEQKNTQSAVFYLASLLCYLQFDTTRRPNGYAAALGLFIAALLSKTTTVTLPPVLLVIFWWQRGTLSWRRDVLPLVPFFLLAVADGAVTTWYERRVAGAEGGGFDLTIAERLVLSGRVAWFYVAKLVWPANLIFFYPRWDIDAGQWWQWLYLATVVAVLIGLWSICGRSRGPMAGALIFLGTLFPVLGFLNIYYFRYAFVTDHFQYLASLGIIVPVAALIARGIARLPPASRTAPIAACVVLVGVLATLTWRQSWMYGSDEAALYVTTLQQNPECWQAYNNLGMEHLSAGRFEAAAEQFRQSLKFNPDNSNARANLTVTLAQLGRPAEAIEQCAETLRRDPQDATAQYNWGGILLGQGRAAEAKEHCLEAVRLKPDSAQAWANLATSHAKLGQFDQAVPAAENALRLAQQQHLAALEQRMNALLAMYRSGQTSPPGKPPESMPPARSP